MIKNSTPQTVCNSINQPSSTNQITNSLNFEVDNIVENWLTSQRQPQPQPYPAKNRLQHHFQLPHIVRLEKANVVFSPTPRLRFHEHLWPLLFFLQILTYLLQNNCYHIFNLVVVSTQQLVNCTFLFYFYLSIVLQAKEIALKDIYIRGLINQVVYLFTLPFSFFSFSSLQPSTKHRPICLYCFRYNPLCYIWHSSSCTKSSVS